jgi:hypothetical protein
MTATGRQSGTLKVHLRCWIDEVETAPEYISLDRETRLEDFMGHNCLMNFYFEGLLEMPQQLCASVYIAFNFFYHAVQYTTPRFV